MLYTVFDPDDGHITHSTMVWDADTLGYDGLLADIGHRFIKTLDAPSLTPPDFFYVDTRRLELCARPVMDVKVSKTRVRCGDGDSAVLTNIPKDASARILSSNIEIYPAFKLDAAELEISIPVPCIYRVAIERWPFQVFTVDIEAVAK